MPMDIQSYLYSRFRSFGLIKMYNSNILAISSIEISLNLTYIVFYKDSVHEWRKVEFVTEVSRLSFHPLLQYLGSIPVILVFAVKCFHPQSLKQ